MAIYKIFPIKDSTLYSGFQSLNTGLDSVIECTTDFVNADTDNPTNSSPQSSRFLVEFKNSQILDVLDDLASEKEVKSFLRVFSSKAKGLSNTSTVLINALGQSWNMGTGTYLSSPIITNGCSWKFRLTSGSGIWDTDNPTSGITGSYSISGSSNQGGGAWYTASVSSQSFDYYESLDINVEVTDIVNNWSSSVFENYGFIVRQSPSQEFINDLNNQTELKFFSRDTNTIYPPQLEFRWDDTLFDTGSSDTTIIDTNESLITLSNNKKEYYPTEVGKFDIFVTKKYPPRSFQTSSAYIQNHYLPTSSLYAIKDSKTDEYVIDFDSNYTKISSDINSSYFKIFMNGLEPERYYTVLIKTFIDGETKIFDERMEFKIING